MDKSFGVIKGIKKRKKIDDEGTSRII